MTPPTPTPDPRDTTWACCGHDMVQHGPGGCEILTCQCGHRRAGRVRGYEPKEKK